MPNDKNPYSSPAAVEQHAADTSEVAAGLGGGLAERFCIWFLESVVTLIALGYLISFGACLFMPTRYGGTIFQTYPVEVFAYLFRGVGFAVLSWLLFRYAMASRKVKTADDFQIFSRRHGALWNWGAVVFLVLVAFSIGMAAWSEMNARPW